MQEVPINKALSGKEVQEIAVKKMVAVFERQITHLLKNDSRVLPYAAFPSFSMEFHGKVVLQLHNAIDPQLDRDILINYSEGDGRPRDPQTLETEWQAKMPAKPANIMRQEAGKPISVLRRTPSGFKEDEVQYAAPVKVSEGGQGTKEVDTLAGVTVTDGPTKASAFPERGNAVVPAMATATVNPVTGGTVTTDSLTVGPVTSGMAGPDTVNATADMPEGAVPVADDVTQAPAPKPKPIMRGAGKPKSRAARAVGSMPDKRKPVVG